MHAKTIEELKVGLIRAKQFPMRASQSPLRTNEGMRTAASLGLGLKQTAFSNVLSH